MKILFAVSNENVSRRIVDNYQDKYQETVSFKNVFYFNAITREIKNDKTYDRIVISEDLEPFANSNYDVIDKFILERLKEISNETNALEKIPDIVVICTDRRTKSGYVLTKMHEYGIYNALIGSDRKIDAVCDLLNRPRNSEEAKEYYQIEGSTVDTSSVDDVTEQEVQNILIHYKRLGKNEDRYTDSFNNIAAQYTDKQLKIIIKCLPINVRAVLEAECPKYQELVTYADETEEERKAKEKLQEQRRIEQIENDRKLKQKIEKEKKEAFKTTQRENNRPMQENKNHINSGIDLLDTKNTQPRMTGNVIIPNSMDIKNERKIYSDEELQNMNSNPREGRISNTEMYNSQPQGNYQNQVFEENVNMQETNNPILPEIETKEEQPVEQTNSLPGLDDWDKDPFADINTAESQTTQMDSLPGLNDWDKDPFDDINNEMQTDSYSSSMQETIANTDIDTFTNQAAELENPVLPGMEETTLPGFDNLSSDMQNTEVNALPGLDDWDKDPFDDINNGPVPSEPYQPQEQTTQTYADPFALEPQTTMSSRTDITLPGLEDISATENAVQNVESNISFESTLPGFEDMTSQANTLPGMEDISTSETTLPGLEDMSLNQFDSLAEEENTTNQTTNTMDMFAGLEQTLNTPEINNEMTQPVIENQVTTENNIMAPQLQMPDVSAVPEIPQEPKRGRGRPRKYPIEPPKPKGKRGRPRKNPLPEEVDENSNVNIAEGAVSNDQSLQAVQNSMIEVPETLPPQVANPAAQTQVNTVQNNVYENQQVNNLQYTAATTQSIQQPEVNNMQYNQPTQPVQQQVNNTQYGVQQNPYENQQPVQPMQQVQQTPINNTQYVNQNVEQPQQFTQNGGQFNNQPQNVVGNEQTYNNQTNQYQQNNVTNTDTLPGFNDWNINSTQNNMNENPSVMDNNSLPGLDDWDQEPFANENTSSINQATSNNGTLPGLDDEWNRDPFEESNDTLPGIDNSVGYSLENDEDTLSSSVVSPYNSYEENMSNSMSEQNNYNSQQYSNQMNNNEYQQNNNYNQYDSFNVAPQPSVGFGMQDNMNEQVTSYSPSQERRESLQRIEENKSYSTGSLNSILTRDKKIVAFVGASKSGTSFLVNNLACLFSSIGVKTAILDMTKNKNSYFIYTNNEEELRNVAYNSIENLEKGYAQGIPVDRNLNVYTTIPNDGKDYSNAEAILSTLVQNESLILVDCDFETDLGYLANAQEIYLVQSMDILTIQPLTAFLRDLKTKGILDQEKLRIVINKETKVRGLSSKAIIGGISFYNDPAMSYMTELFNKDKVKACSIPFDESIYSRYLESIVNCAITISGYNKNFMNSLKILGNMVYPLLSKQTYGSKSSAEANYGNNFSTEMNNTLNQMKNKY